jgi:hypothetical protein
MPEFWAANPTQPVRNQGTRDGDESAIGVKFEAAPEGTASMLSR